MIVFDHVNFAYERSLPVIKDLSFTIQPGQSVGLIGANGAGKSTVMKLLLGLLSGSGRIEIDGLEMNTANLAPIRRRLGFVLQNSDNQMFMPTVFEDMMFGPVNYGMSPAEAEKRVDEILAGLELSGLKHRYNHKISGGEKKMAAIATVLAMDPEHILLDEPTASLDPLNRRKVISIINSLSCTKLITSHDLDMILDTCSRVILLSDGRIAADGPAKILLTQKDLLEKHNMELPLRFQH